MDVAMLVRRVKDRLVTSRKLMCIGTSATMSNAHDELERAAAVARVGKLIFGEELSAASIIDENLARATDPRINSVSLGRTLKDAVLAPTPDTLTDKDLFTHPLACWIETEIGLLEGEKLRRRPPMTLSEGGSALSAQTGVARVLSHQLDSGGARFGRPAAPHAAVAARHVRNASSRKTRSVRRDMRWRWTLNVFWTAA